MAKNLMVIFIIQILKKEYENKLSELENKFSAISRKQTTMVLQKEAITHERDVSSKYVVNYNLVVVPRCLSGCRVPNLGV